MKKVVFHIALAGLDLLSRLPFRLLYALSDLVYILTFYVFAYRHQVVLENLERSFPGKSDSEIKLLSRQFYHHLCDLLFEAFKLKTISPEKLKKRMTIVNPELVNRYFDEGKSVIVLTMHYNNWEWNAILPHQLKHHCLLVYNPARNLRWDAAINQMRERFGGELVSTKKIVKKVLDYEKRQKPTLTWLCADQRPLANARFWTTFLNQDAGFFPGPEALARRTNFPVLYQHVEKVKRGHYRIHFELLADSPASLPPDEILHRYVRKIESRIQAQPEFYLWSHKRWKHQKSAQNNRTS